MRLPIVDELAAMEDLGGMENDLVMMEDDLGTMEDDLGAMEDDLMKYFYSPC